jgi:hypothetical protein
MRDHPILPRGAMGVKILNELIVEKPALGANDAILTRAFDEMPFVGRWD